MTNLSQNLPAVVSGPAQQNFDALNGRLAALEQAGEWVAPTLLNSWQNYETAGSNMEVAYRRAPDGRITVRGLIKHAGSIPSGEPSTVFILPAGFRPSKEIVFPGFESSTSGFTIAANIVFANGEVLFVPALTAAVGYASLNISFYAD